MTVTVGELAPDFEVLASNGERLKLSDFRGQHVVLYFYPKDLTPGCTTEACDFRDRQKEFSELNATILGISADELDSHKKFAEKHGLPFLLLVDEDHKVSEQFGVWTLKKNFGKEYMGIQRSTFVIDKDGVLVKEWRNVKVDGHVEAALEFIKNHLADA
ncbi:thioredoxin-dependent thiol peroxidase [Caldibacillus lycopersici]|uniref:thioredoxin-dependent peroxiredoxin n=1 Tax=Perspicuibacillus lycopersici TaxID=1325689 RepID=A0AAE3LP76_9BACI|nr:thioredoxin-dependent thiol peroxidase [Perspicuibacillus lycopersici]MCU9614652.1 thioredoxin-dependent thiol peroxidase [Perspicuibacillus lycopersici]